MDELDLVEDGFEIEYRRLIAEKLLKRDGTPIPNGTLRHASLLIEAIFGNAQRSVKILTGELNARVYGTSQVIAKALQFLANSDHSLDIVFESTFDDGEAARHPLLSAIRESPNVQLWRLSPSATSELKFHCALMDDDSYRYEGDKTKPAAIAAFGDRDFARTLGAVFAALRTNHSTKLEVAPVPA